jgi:hypothetical protein
MDIQSVSKKNVYQELCGIVLSGNVAPSLVILG